MSEVETVCRILFAMGPGEGIESLARAFMKSAENDPYRARRGGKSQHRDGWGYVLLSDGSVHHYRSARAVFEDGKGFSRLVELLRESDNAVLLAHARASSQGSLGLFNVQPFAFSTRRGFSFWFLHNGDLEKEKIIALAGFEGEDLRDASDSYAFSAYLCRVLQRPEKEELLKHYSLGASLAKTTFNTATLFLLPDGHWRAFVTAYMTNEYWKNDLHRDYARLIELDGDVLAVASSTLELYHKADWKNIPNGTALLITPGGIERLPLG
ncbi:class II glutamine amidotransferase [Thermococcus sp. 21S9]|uniref:class II glutamine amidotransferase n=1 Tax=Thermococcus sp. 21S9 TaxID=1638223 RepID=UPI00197D46B0|nr:class II glutamine amidotransferase [Thermococcus sp. 21S9]